MSHLLSDMWYSPYESLCGEALFHVYLFILFADWKVLELVFCNMLGSDHQDHLDDTHQEDDQNAQNIYYSFGILCFFFNKLLWYLDSK